MKRICGATFVFDREGEPDLIGRELTNGAYRHVRLRAARRRAHAAHITRPLRGLLIYSPGDAEHITQPV